MAAVLASRNGTPSGLILDKVGIFWLCFGSIWTVILICGMMFLYRRRHMPILRIRGLPLSFVSVILLHTYWLAVQWGYTYAHFMPEYVEFWIMGLWLPFGIALFHASNSRFLYVAQAQKRFIMLETQRRLPDSKKRTTWKDRYRGMDYTRKILATVCAGMILQFSLTVLMFFISRKFHPGFGIPGTETHGTPAEQEVQAGKGWEWWHSVVWQFMWAWVVAPFILWRSRGFRDTLGWRMQTIACCLSSLHATPMWLVALYVPAMAPVNKYWIPPQWLAVSIMLLEVFTIFLPCYETLKHQYLHEETREAIARWESRNKTTSTKDSLATGLNEGSSFHALLGWGRGKGTDSVSGSCTGGSILTMDALEHTLNKNPEPLQHFSALNDFSGENVAFLMRVAQWRQDFYPPPITEKNKKRFSKRDTIASISTVRIFSLREAFESALRIYIEFVSTRAEFQLNLSSPDFKMLESVFEVAAEALYGDLQAADPATPFETSGWRVGAESERSVETGDTATNDDADSISIPHFWGQLPEDFNEHIFDNAEQSIKYLVLTNTWSKFVRQRRSVDSVDTLDTLV